jgi:long-chain acyl-CoA synthetase
MLTGDIVRYNAIKYPKRLAIVYEDGSHRTYQELNARVNRLSNALASLGVSKGDRVNLLARNYIECIESFFACAKLGAIYSPLNFRMAPEELVYCLNDAGAQVLLVHHEYVETVQKIRGQLETVEKVVGFGGAHPFELDYEDVLAAAAPTEPTPTEPITEDDVCWICYTGGTTGLSKGVMLTHRNNFTQIVNLSFADRIRHEDVYMITGALFHVVLNMGLPYFFAGATVVILNFEPDKCLNLIAETRTNKLVPVATMLNLLIDKQNRSPRDLSCIELMGLGGAPISPDTVRMAGEAFNCDFVQYFGQTEAAHHFTYLSAEDYRRGLGPDASEQERKRLLSGGRAQHCCLMRVVDDDDHDLPIGEVGEILGYGQNVMKGYWNKPELTAQTLRGGWLHTGDMGYLDEDGYVYVVDRKKDMIVSGGENVYCSEVERVLYQHMAVLECAVIGVPDQKWGEAVKAIIVPKSGTQVQADEVIAFCKERLAGYKVPKSVDIIEAMPKSATGKIRKTDLREHYWVGITRRVGAV